MQFHRLVTFVIFSSCIGAAALSGQTASFSEHDPRYRLEPSDVLEVHYRYTPEFDQTVTVQPDGFVPLQIVGDLKLQGLTLDQVKTEILARARLRLKDPEITLVLKEFEKPYFVVGGEVGAPGRFEMRGTVTAIEAIAVAGGFKNSAKHSQVILFRKVSPDLAKTQILDLKAAMNGISERNIDLRPGDMLMVPPNKISKIERVVKIVNIGAYVPF
jgi:polysaccharide export outer membrane protein